jgi:NPCBM/NEW2 domain
VSRLSLALSLAGLLVFAADGGASSGGKAVKIAASTTPWTVVKSHVAITGTVTPHPPGITVTLQQRQGTGWLAVSETPVHSNGTFSFRTEPSRVGLATYRVVTTKGTSYVGSSARVPVRVLHWRYVTDIAEFEYVTPTPGSGSLTTDPIVSDGVRYEHAISLDPGCYNQWGGNAWIDFILERQYEQFSATVGLDDQAASGATATYVVLGGDGRKLATGSLVRSEATKVKVSVSGEYRLRLWVNVPDPNNAAGCSPYFTHVVFADAQLLGP